MAPDKTIVISEGWWFFTALFRMSCRYNAIFCKHQILILTGRVQMRRNISELQLRCRRAQTIGVVLGVFFLSGCVSTQNVQQIDRLESVTESPRVILMPPDIRYYLLTASGLPEPRADWTKAAQENFTSATTDFARSIGTDLTILDPDDIGETEIAYEQLHSAVGMTILTHHFGMTKLPTKGNGQVFDWSLGSDISSLAERHDADYALFVYYRDYQASGGRVAFAILAAAAGGVVPTGSEHGFASLVDLRSGDVVWFNVVGAGGGELREEAGATAAVNTLFKDIPTAQGPAKQP